MKIAKLLDKQNVVVSGTPQELGSLFEGAGLLVLAIGAPFDETGIPLVVPKAALEVRTHAGSYVIASPPEVQVSSETEPTGAIASILMTRTRTVRTRPPLNVEERAIDGNPGARPIAVGDPVIQRNDLATFVKSLSTAPGKAQ